MREALPLPWERLAAPAPWEAALLPTGALPSEPKDVARWGRQVASLEAALLQKPNCQRELLLQVWKLGPGHGAEVLEEHAGPWWPQLGLGVWPDREPPRSWNEEMLQDAMAGALNGDEVPLASHKLLTLKATGEEQSNAAHLLRGHGALLQVFGAQPLARMQALGRELFLPTMVENRFRKARFFLPLLDRQSLAAARDGAELGRWLCGAEVYVRESAEDRGVLVIGNMALAPLLRQEQLA